jgi:hypothetical protein
MPASMMACMRVLLHVSSPCDVSMHTRIHDKPTHELCHPQRLLPTPELQRRPLIERPILPQRAVLQQLCGLQWNGGTGGGGQEGAPV